MKTFIFVRNKKYRPSTYYRIYQYLKDEVNEDFELIEYETDGYYNKKSRSRMNKLLNIIFNSLIPGYINRLFSMFKILKENKDYNIFIQRECFPQIIEPLGKVLLKRVICNASKVYWDFDDNIFEAKEITKFEENLLKRYSTKIFVGNEYLWEKLDLADKDKVVVVNTTDTMMEEIDLAVVNHQRESSFNQELILVWVGTKGNLKYLEDIVPQLDEAASKIKDKRLVLKVISDGDLNRTTEHLIVKNIKWERKIAFNEMLSAHIGLMPLIETEFTKGKCAFKAVQAIGCGLPVIVSDVGMNKEVVSNQNGVLIKNNEGWSEAVVSLSSSMPSWEKKSRFSRELWLERYNSKKTKDLLLNMLMGL